MFQAGARSSNSFLLTGIRTQQCREFTALLKGEGARWQVQWVGLYPGLTLSHYFSSLCWLELKACHQGRCAMSLSKKLCPITQDSSTLLSTEQSLFPFCCYRCFSVSVKHKKHFAIFHIVVIGRLKIPTELVVETDLRFRGNHKTLVRCYEG